MEIRRTLVADCPVDDLFGWVDDLAVYPKWMRLIHEVELADDDLDPNSDAAPAWNVELHATVGPFTRSKRLRMVRAEHRAPELAVFERSEVDGREHSAWVLRVALRPLSQHRSELVMELHYGGNLWTGMALQRVLDDEVEHASLTLQRLVSPAPTR